MNAPVKTPAKAAKVTPMMAQYLAIKAEAGEEILLFYRMGDFYELFFDDAVKAAAALDIALTKRGKHQGADIPMCGVPVHSAQAYLQRLIKKGFRVAVCEQTEDPKEAKKRGSKAVVRREVVRVVTPGTLTEDALLDARGTNYILSVSKTSVGDYALAWADVSDGRFYVCDVDPNRVMSEIAALSPREIVLPESLYLHSDNELRFDMTGASLTPLPKTKFDPRSTERRLCDIYNVQSLDGFGAFSKGEISAAGALADYLELTQAGGQVRLSPPARRQTSGYMAIDPATRAGLEINRTQSGKKQGSLLSVVDRTVTGPGARLLSDRLNRPLTDLATIKARHDAVSWFTDQPVHREAVRVQLKEAGDPARAAGRLVLGRGGPRDMRAVCNGLKTGESLSAALSEASDTLPDNLRQAVSDLALSHTAALAELIADIDRSFLSEGPLLARDGGFISDGVSAELDELKRLRDDSRRIVAGLQAQYAEQAGVPTLKVKHNNVLGYFLEVTPKYADQMLSMGADSPFIHRQTLVSGVRFTTTELADLDAKISGAAEKALAVELAIFEGFVDRVTALSDPIRKAAEALAILDVASASAEQAMETQAVRPQMDDSTVLDVVGGRHPVVEASLKASGDGAFTANDCRSDAAGAEADRLTLITGPNMAGKSTYLRQNALMFVLAQAGLFVPAQSARIGIADSLFSRVGASDDLSRGRSTFMTEMIETAAILNAAGPRSFVILDEIGRGTATFDGLSIAWATAEHLHAVNQCRALFATHYHELTDLADSLDAAGNACLHAKEWDGDLIFLHDVRPGAADKSYGVQVARLAGLPPAAVSRAREVLTRLESQQDGPTAPGLGGLPLFSAPAPAPLVRPSVTDSVLQDLDPNDLSPREALDLLYDLKAKLAESRN